MRAGAAGGIETQHVASPPHLLGSLHDCVDDVHPREGPQAIVRDGLLVDEVVLQTHAGVPHLLRQQPLGEVPGRAVEEEREKIVDEEGLEHEGLVVPHHVQVKVQDRQSAHALERGAEEYARSLP